MKIRCKDCKYWVQNTFYPYPGVINWGFCNKLDDNASVSIDISGDDGYINSITTKSDFFCALFDLQSNTNE
jgi:hypothetical protein